MKQKELVVYYIVDLNGKNIFFESGTFMQAVELCGEAPAETLAQAFLFWRDTAQEIIYRPNKDAKAFLIFSLLDEERYFREADILGPVRWSDADLDSFSLSQEKDVKKEVEINFESLTKESADSKNRTESFLRMLYSIQSDKDEVRLFGSFPPFLLLMTLDWFAIKAKRIFYNDTQIV